MYGNICGNGFQISNENQAVRDAYLMNTVNCVDKIFVDDLHFLI